MLVIRTMIRHASPSGPPVTADFGRHAWRDRAELAPDSVAELSLCRVASGFLRAGSDAVGLTSIASPADKGT